MIIDKNRSILLVIDVQERLAPSMAAPDAIIRNCGILMKGAARMGVPVVVSQQYPKGLGATVPELAKLAPPGAFYDKLHFSCMADTTIAAQIEAQSRDQIVVSGIEAHICVLQTALGLIEHGFGVFVVGDAVGSRRDADRDAALRRMTQVGATVVSTEMVLFEWLEQAGTPEFKELQALVK